MGQLSWWIWARLFSEAVFGRDSTMKVWLKMSQFKIAMQNSGCAILVAVFVICNWFKLSAVFESLEASSFSNGHVCGQGLPLAGFLKESERSCSHKPSRSDQQGSSTNNSVVFRNSMSVIRVSDKRRCRGASSRKISTIRRIIAKTMSAPEKFYGEEEKKFPVGHTGSDRHEARPILDIANIDVIIIEPDSEGDRSHVGRCGHTYGGGVQLAPKEWVLFPENSICSSVATVVILTKLIFRPAEALLKHDRMVTQMYYNHKQFLAAPISARNEAVHVFTNERLEPFQSVLFGRVLNGLYLQFKTATDNAPWCTMAGSYLDVHVGHDNSDRCVFLETHQGITTATIPMLTERWPIKPGQWIMARVTMQRFQTQSPHTKEFHVTVSDLRVLDVKDVDQI
ncbi:hypothetical protein B0H17DRAFT_1137280 [Mycena rosella]|uniref:Uncharacterized protein n=1 Tax=Mycena rosella TaxID=1033263 RepID=A0AAD7GFR2_MYCRO|nr:hypothetical protein B0H17DRAFT_1137280 [Mycena rosella]